MKFKLLSKTKIAAKTFAVYFAILIVLAIFGMLLKTLAYAVPSQSVQSNIQSGQQLFEQWGNYPIVNVYSVDKRTSQLDFFTEAELVVGAWAVDSTNPFISAVENYSFSDSGADKLNQIVSGNDENLDETIRDKYWWGALTILRPLLGIMDYAEASALLQGVYLCLFFACGLFIYKTIGKMGVIAFVAAFIFVDGMTAGMLYATAFSVMCGFLGVIAVCKTENLTRDFSIILFITGIATAYFDWLSSPLISCGLPILVGVVILYQNKSLQKFWPSVWQILKAGLGWCFGWIGMIGAKWCFSFVVSGNSLGEFLHEALMGDIVAETMTTPFVITCIKLVGSTLPGRFLITRLLQNTNADANYTDLYAFVKETALADPMALILPNLWVLVAIFALIIAFGILLFRCFKFNKSAFNAAVLCLCVAVVPFAWALVMGRHTSAHYWFVYRMLAMSFMGLILSLWFVIKAQKGELNEKAT